MEPTQADFERVVGYEFEWFALDEAGVIALFSTAGYGTIPVEVMRHEQAHRLIAERLDALTREAKDVWEEYGRLGLFVFDWQHSQGPYRKVAAPALGIRAELRAEILAIPGLPKLVPRFGLVASVAIPRFEA